MNSIFGIDGCIGLLIDNYMFEKSTPIDKLRCGVDLLQYANQRSQEDFFEKELYSKAIHLINVGYEELLRQNTSQEELQQQQVIDNVIKLRNRARKNE